jgi:hypothetical protein
MQRQPINPWPWSHKLGFDQAQLIRVSARFGGEAARALSA